MSSVFLTVMLSYERTEKNIPGPMGLSSEEERFGWVIRINGLINGPLDKDQLTILQDFPNFMAKDEQLELTCFEDEELSYDRHDQFHPPMTLVTKFLNKIVMHGYNNTSSCMTAEKNEITYCLWNFQKPLTL